MKDEALIDKDAIEELEGVKGAFSSSGQFQIIFWNRFCQQSI